MTGKNPYKSQSGLTDQFPLCIPQEYSDTNRLRCGETYSSILSWGERADLVQLEVMRDLALQMPDGEFPAMETYQQENRMGTGNEYEHHRFL